MGAVREDYGESGDAWDYVNSPAPAYRLGEKGLAGLMERLK